VSVLLNDRLTPDGGPGAPWTSDELSRIEGLVANAIGLDRPRGDLITVVSAPFTITSPTVEPISSPSILMTIPRYRQEIITGIGLLMAFIIGLQVVRALRATAPAPGRTAALGSGPRSESVLPAGDPAAVAAAAPFAGTLTRSTDSPEMAARVLRAWLKE
jgi:flagellar M-ring protein FliF